MNARSRSFATAYSDNYLFSRGTLEIDCPSGGTVFALTERKQPGVYRWAIVKATGQIIEDGFEPTQAGASLAAASALRIALAHESWLAVQQQEWKTRLRQFAWRREANCYGFPRDSGELAKSGEEFEEI